MYVYRVELLVMIFDRIVDIHNFEFINMLLNAEEQAAVYARIGIYNPIIVPHTYITAIISFHVLYVCMC
jgi:hypothetical protein